MWLLKSIIAAMNYEQAFSNLLQENPGLVFPFTLLLMNRITGSQNHRIVGAGRDLQRSSSPTALQNRPPTADFTSRCPGKSWISPEEENPQPPWAACSSALSPLLWRSSFAYWCRTSHASVCGHFLLFYHHTLLRSVWPFPFASHILDIYRHLSDPPSVFFFQGWTDPGCSAFPHRGDGLGPLSSLWLSAGLSSRDPCLFFCTGEPRTR